MLFIKTKPFYNNFFRLSKSQNKREKVHNSSRSASQSRHHSSHSYSTHSSHVRHHSSRSASVSKPRKQEKQTRTVDSVSSNDESLEKERKKAQQKVKNALHSMKIHADSEASLPELTDSLIHALRKSQKQHKSHNSHK